MTFERRALGPRGHVLVSTTLEADGVLAAFTERTGGHSEEPYDTLNLSLAVGDDDAAVRTNRAMVIDALGIPAFATAEQVHGARLVRVGGKRAGAGFEAAAERIPGADALATSSAGVSLAVLAADCVPLVLHSPREHTCAVVHAGWRGIAAGIVGAVASGFEEATDVRVAIGPAIGPDHYEVGEDVALAVASGTDTGAVTERKGGRTSLDLVATIRNEFRAVGIRHVEDTGLCTACESRRFFSYRREEVTGRQAAVAALLGKAGAP